MNNPLTILIPTYERPGKLLKILNLLRDLTANLPHIRIIVSDNSESEQARDINKASAKGFTYYLNDNNLGFAGNLIRLLELCDNGYVWFLSDDDLLHIDPTRKLLELSASFTANDADCILLPFTYLDYPDQFNISSEFGHPQTVDQLFSYGQKLPFVLFSSFLLRLPEWFQDPQQKKHFIDQLKVSKGIDLLQIIIVACLLLPASKVKFWPDSIIKYIPADVGRFLPSSLLRSELSIADLLESKGWLSPEQATRKKRQYTANQIKHALRVRAGLQENSFQESHQDFRALPFADLVLRALSPQVLAWWAVTLLPNSIIKLLDRIRRG